MGVKKSVVSTSARSLSSRSTAASSPSTAPISRSPDAGCRSAASEPKSSSSLASGSLQAQPAPGESDVSRTGASARSVTGVLQQSVEDRKIDAIRPAVTDGRRSCLDGGIASIGQAPASITLHNWHYACEVGPSWESALRAELFQQVVDLVLADGGRGRPAVDEL